MSVRNWAVLHDIHGAAFGNYASRLPYQRHPCSNDHRRRSLNSGFHNLLLLHPKSLQVRLQLAQPPKSSMHNVFGGGGGGGGGEGGGGLKSGNQENGRLLTLVAVTTTLSISLLGFGCNSDATRFLDRAACRHRQGPKLQDPRAFFQCFHEKDRLFQRFRVSG